MSTYSPGGRAARILAFLDRGDASKDEALAVAFPHDTPERRRRRYGLLAAMLDDGFILTGGGTCWLTRAGREALNQLEAGVAVETAPAPVPTVRFFARTA